MIVEYILILLVLVTIGGIITRSLVSRNPDDLGVLIEQWSEVLKTIGQDNPHQD